MSNALQPLFPALHTLEPLGLPATFREWFASASSAQAERLAAHLLREFKEVAHAGALDHAYLRSPGFQANVVQAVRAAEVAESDGKLRLIARALAGCALLSPPPSVDRFQTMRLIEALSERELSVLAGLYAALDPVDPYADVWPVQGRLTGLTRQETDAALLGLSGLGALRRCESGSPESGSPESGGPESGGWQLTPLARQLALLARFEPPDPLFGERP